MADLSLRNLVAYYVAVLNGMALVLLPPLYLFAEVLIGGGSLVLFLLVLGRGEGSETDR